MPKGADQHKRIAIGKAHQAAARHKPREHRGSARERGYSTAWDKFSRAFIRSNPLCEFCLPTGKLTPAKVTDHDIPHEGDADLFWTNTFTALCQSCHSKTKQSLEARYSGQALLDAIARHKAGGVARSLPRSEQDRRG